MGESAGRRPEAGRRAAPADGRRRERASLAGERPPRPGHGLRVVRHAFTPLMNRIGRPAVDGAPELIVRASASAVRA